MDCERSITQRVEWQSRQEWQKSAISVIPGEIAYLGDGNDDGNGDGGRGRRQRQRQAQWHRRHDGAKSAVGGQGAKSRDMR